MVQVVGLGTQDTFKEAQQFVTRYDMRSLQMLWDPTFGSWRQLGVTSQPAAILFDRHGGPVKGWLGPFDEGQVLDLAARA